MKGSYDQTVSEKQSNGHRFQLIFRRTSCRGLPTDLTHTDLAVLQEQQRKGQRSQRWWKRFQEGQREGLEKLRHFEAFGYHLMRPGLRLTADPRNDGPGTLRSRKTGIVHGDFTL